MTAPAAFQGTYSDFRLVKGRKVAQIVVEVPIEAADHALEVLGGVPRPDAERHVAVARLSPGSGTAASQGSSAERGQAPRSTPEPGESKERRRFSELPLPQQVALRCTDKKFQEWLCVANEDEAAEAVRRECGVASRSAIQWGSDAGTKWADLDAAFLELTGQATERRR